MAGPLVAASQVGVGDRLALDPDLLALDRHGDRLLLGGHVLAQPGPAPLPSLGPDLQLLLRAGHGVIGGRPRGVAAHGAVLDVVIDPVTVTVARVDALSGGAGGQAAIGAVLAVVEAVVAVQLGLVVLGQAPVGPHGWGARDLVLVVGHLDAVTGGLGLGERHEDDLGGEQAGVDQGPLGLAGLVIEVDGVDRAELVAGRVDHGPTLPALDGLDAWCCHGTSLPIVQWMIGCGGLQGWVRSCGSTRHGGRVVMESDAARQPRRCRIPRFGDRDGARDLGASMRS